jgi:RNA polymerase sigma-70 factor, ECF subfamily
MGAPSGTLRLMSSLRQPAVVTSLGERWSNDAIARGLAQRQPAALAALFDRFSPLVNRVVRRLLGTDPEHDDLVQQVFLAALDAGRRLADPTRLESWMVGLTTNTVRRALRDRTTWRRFFTSAAPDVEAPSLEKGPHQVLVARRLHALLGRLDVDERLAFALRALDERTLPEVAEACGCSLATAKRRVAAAQDKLARLMQDDPLLADYVVRGDHG